MPLVHPCSRAGCSTLTMGTFCLEHEPAAPEPPPRSHRLAALTGLAVAGLAAALLARVRLPL